MAAKWKRQFKEVVKNKKARSLITEAIDWFGIKL